MMRRPSPSRDASPRPSRRSARAAVLLLAGAATLLTAPAALAAPTAPGPAQVRATHLVPDLPTMDIDLAPVADGVTGPPVGTVAGAGYGDVSRYSPLPAGAYAVSVRPAGSSPGATPVLTGTVQVRAGHAYTLAALGTAATGRLVPLDDDLAAPAAGHAKVRVLSAASTAPAVDVAATGGPVVAQAVAFGSATGYADVPAGRWTLAATSTAGTGSTPAAGRTTVRLAAGSTYTLAVTDGKGALRVTPVGDAVGPARTPTGGASTGAGGTAAGADHGTATSAGVGALAGAGLAAAGLVVRGRRRVAS